MVSKRSLLAGLAAALIGCAAPATAQDYPTRPVRIIVPFDPGGINDVAARVVATHLTQRLGKQVIVENKPGAGGVVGTELAAQAAPDGYTLVSVSVANAVHPALYKLRFDPLKSFDMVSMFIDSPNVLAVNAAVPAKTLKEFIDLVKAKPDEFSYASGGVGGSLHLGMELFLLVSKTKMLHIPFRGGGPAAIDTIAGNTKAIVATSSTVNAGIASGQLRGLAVSAKQRLAALPDVPTFAEAGLPEYEAGNWIGFAVPAGTPKPIIERLHKEIAAIQDMPEVKQEFLKRGADVVKMNPAELQAYYEKQIATWTEVVKTGGIKVE
ncbi:MAG TPA: tripartite tricarboxylate transporter substrate binding protein [Microvirga sp.]|jgi:tripartite-type tricarboxylate transporter receptor subunit TctC|nr:tripartite tricarboxylate transporter substrate binding protein [Microvirga sp.]